MGLRGGEITKLSATLADDWLSEVRGFNERSSSSSNGLPGRYVPNVREICEVLSIARTICQLYPVACVYAVGLAKDRAGRRKANAKILEIP